MTRRFDMAEVAVAPARYRKKGGLMSIRGAGSKARLAGLFAFTASGLVGATGLVGVPATAMAADALTVAAMARPAWAALLDGAATATSLIAR